MRVPALVPAVATLVGVVAGLEFGEPSPWVALCLVTAWATSLASLAARSPRLVLASAGIGFLSAGWIVGTAASDRLMMPRCATSWHRLRRFGRRCTSRDG